MASSQRTATAAVVGIAVATSPPLALLRKGLNPFQFQ
jgi:hypothetical protein